ncbi:DoxX family protein [Paenibacillus sacheonensis]|uniref:DoxX family protein n=1 Tax=Paenibacillus sacheonensis TaxID=742054 RepID=A0A7X4YPT4_9BACL|nr:DoxX family protein [Paenibacillus sacheonensis]MBM7564972.1 hypothetical protein [Paenibacillus sacheonensis]NBC70240.1 DoxX family protein [Paenibacillus sacheonensis]
MHVLSLVLQSLLTAYYLFSGGAKIAGAKYWTDIFTNLGLPQRLRTITGLVQLIGAASLIIGYWYEGAIGWAGIWLGVTMLGACLAHVRVKDPAGKTAPALVFMALILVLTLVNTDGMLHPFS